MGIGMFSRQKPSEITELNLLLIEPGIIIANKVRKMFCDFQLSFAELFLLENI